ncbi:hypothetical protein B0T26DRAFT_874029 [Lasiosphaeria miniovina]|uniref:Uncharacterized protein n=1 Tax=Lasiosphaeria miniovina TaxID=1954250 RepID=A0AA40ADW4_9PEZI|nr:uncharacterized protein B0T26DRAFT_874029 [Lasiosphaeria miniovina]KAK0714053.1 hypothetical protein B0T26DRAFT_874029 [Lasiosphaeria miniovina]
MESANITAWELQIGGELEREATRMLLVARGTGHPHAHIFRVHNHNHGEANIDDCLVVDARWFGSHMHEDDRARSLARLWTRNNWSRHLAADSSFCPGLLDNDTQAAICRALDRHFLVQASLETFSLVRRLFKDGEADPSLGPSAAATAALVGNLQTLLANNPNPENNAERELRGIADACLASSKKLIAEIDNTVTEANALRARDEFHVLNNSLKNFILRYSDGMTEISALLEAIRSQVKLEFFQVRIDQERRRLLGSIKYPGMKERRNSISQHHKDTFEWTFPGQNDKTDVDDQKKTRWNSFTDWIKSDDNIY